MDGPEKGKGKKGNNNGKGSWTNDNTHKRKQLASQNHRVHNDIRCYRCDGEGH